MLQFSFWIDSGHRTNSYSIIMLTISNVHFSLSTARPMISASLPGEALGQLGVLPLGHLYPPPPPSGMTPEFLAPQPRPYARYNPRRRDVMPTPPAPAPYPSVPAYPFLPHPASYAPYMYRRAQQQPTYPIRPRASSGFVPPAPAPHSPPTAPAPVPTPREVSKHYSIPVQLFTPSPAPYPSVSAYRFLPHPGSFTPYPRALQDTTYPNYRRASSVFEPPAPVPHAPPTAPAAYPPPRAVSIVYFETSLLAQRNSTDTEPVYAIEGLSEHYLLNKDSDL